MGQRERDFQICLGSFQKIETYQKQHVVIQLEAFNSKSLCKLEILYVQWFTCVGH